MGQKQQRISLILAVFDEFVVIAAAQKNKCPALK
jgi:hypothetical protein